MPPLSDESQAMEEFVSINPFKNFLGSVVKKHSDDSSLKSNPWSQKSVFIRKKWVFFSFPKSRLHNIWCFSFLSNVFHLSGKWQFQTWASNILFSELCTVPPYPRTCSCLQPCGEFSHGTIPHQHNFFLPTFPLACYQPIFFKDPGAKSMLREHLEMASKYK